MSILVGRKAPDFTASAVMANGELVDNYHFAEMIKDKYALLFFYPLDFTFVCPSELIAADHRVAQFKEMNVELIGVSIDSAFTHHAWRSTPVNKGGIGPVNYSLVADIKHEIIKAYGVEHPEAGVAFRGSFLIDKAGIVRSQMINDLPLGRNFDEAIRLFEALQFHEKHGEVCPAGWKAGDAGMKPNADGVASYLANNADNL